MNRPCPNDTKNLCQSQINSQRDRDYKLSAKISKNLRTKLAIFVIGGCGWWLGFVDSVSLGLNNL